MGEVKCLYNIDQRIKGIKEKKEKVHTHLWCLHKVKKKIPDDVFGSGR